MTMTFGEFFKLWVKNEGLTEDDVWNSSYTQFKSWEKEAKALYNGAKRDGLLWRLARDYGFDLEEV